MSLRRACIIGHPVAHSRSPMIHGHWLALHGISGSYERKDIAPAQFPDFLGNLQREGYVGANVTVPHKEAALALVEADDRARAIGAVNTVWDDKGVLRGTNTDVSGFIANLDAEAPGWDQAPGRAVVLGAGGAARAVVFGLLERGFEQIVLINRDQDRAQRIADDFDAKRVTVTGWGHVADALEDAKLLVNATSLGMTGKPPLSIDLGAVPSTAVVNDLVYAPLETGLLSQARAKGMRTVDGLGMLLHQAVPGFEAWFGVRPVITLELRAIVVKDLEAARS